MEKVCRILVVEDEPDLAELIAYNLRTEGHEVEIAADGAAALQAVDANRPHLILLDLMMPRLTGQQVAERLKQAPATSRIPIIMLTAKSEERDELQGLQLGADDYITKPFSMSVLLARVGTVLRRAGVGVAAKPLTVGPLTIDEQIHSVTLDGEPMKLTLTEFRLLSALIGASGRVLSRRALISSAMGPGVTVTERTIDVHVTSIRKKMGEHASMIRTIRGVGYRLSNETADVESPGA
ncbi:MAG: response regulator [Phycisphaerales bacterium JB059]